MHPDRDRGVVYRCMNHHDRPATALVLVQVEAGRLVARVVQPVLVPLCGTCYRTHDKLALRRRVMGGWRPALEPA
jgi:hypothetical protein